MTEEIKCDELKDDELENVSGGCEKKVTEYKIQGIWSHTCPNGKDYAYVERSIIHGSRIGTSKVDEQYCGSCTHFQPNEPYDWLGPGICRR